jgi:hypothetical protein
MSSNNGIQRFPRKIEDYPKYALGAAKCSKRQRYRAMILSGDTPKGWGRLTRRQKRIARRVASGISVREVCRSEGAKSDTFYHWLHNHRLFQKYFYKAASMYAGHIDKRLDSNVPRAVRVVEDALNSGDQYFAHDAAVQLLKGRGKYQPTTNVKKQGSMSHTFDGSIGINQKIKVEDRKTITLLIEAMTNSAAGGKPVKPKIIDVEAIKALPPATENNALSKIQNREKAERQAVGAD